MAPRWLRALFVSPSRRVSDAWLQSMASQDTKAGWADGPVWRTPKELTEMRRMERRKALRVVERKAR